MNKTIISQISFSAIQFGNFVTLLLQNRSRILYAIIYRMNNNSTELHSTKFHATYSLRIMQEDYEFKFDPHPLQEPLLNILDYS
jgi:hypothetical protein